LLEHLHQSFFFYILLNTNRFVSIGNYLPAAMIMAGSFSITALALWVQSGKAAASDEEEPAPLRTGAAGTQSSKLPEMQVVKDGDDSVLVPKADLEVVEKKMFRPAVLILVVHLAGAVPLYLLTHTSRSVSLYLVGSLL
jgi:glycosylphosphatidylinositol transamidase